MADVLDFSEFMTAGKRARKKTGMPVKRRAAEPFAIVPLRWAERAATAIKAPGFLVCVELLYAGWKANGAAFPFATARLEHLGMNRATKRRVLLDLEQAGLITVERHPGRAPIVTLRAR
jgi:hypothetical protein